MRMRRAFRTSRLSLARPRASAFTLVELVMVMTIIGIIAAIALPRLSGLQGATQGAALLADLRVLRSAIELYATEHAGDFPGDRSDGSGGTARSRESFVSQLTMYTDDTGNVSVQRTGKYKFGPYLFNDIPPLPVGPNEGSNNVKVVLVAPSPDDASSAGWVYNPITGEIIGNVGGDVGGLDDVPTEILDKLNISGVGVGGLGGGMGI